MTPRPTVGVVGASARAAVHSLARAGFSAWAVDLFCDRDLARVAQCVRCPLADYPDALPRLAERFPPGPVMYTGGLENHPQVVAELAAKRKLWGISPTALEAVRDPHRLFPFLSGLGWGRPVPSVLPPGEPCPATGRWVRKPIRSAGGLGIRIAQPGEPASPHHYFQEFIDGVPMSALYCGTALLGVTEQLVGEPWLHARGFHYCGNVGPAALPADVERDLHALGMWLIGELLSWGHWNIDFVCRDGRAVPVELNPRYSASMEVIEHAVRCPVFSQWLPEREGSVVGKAIYYAPHTITFPASGPWDDDLAGEFDPWRLPNFADIPHPGDAFEPGQPVITLFASGSSPAECRERLQSRAAELDRLFADQST